MTMRDAKNFRPHPANPGQWFEIEVVPEQVSHHREGGERRLVRGHLDKNLGLSLPDRVESDPVRTVEIVEPAYETPTGYELTVGPDQSLEERIAELNKDEQ